MPEKQGYEELEQRVKELEEKSIKSKEAEKAGVSRISSTNRRGPKRYLKRLIHDRCVIILLPLTVGAPTAFLSSPAQTLH